MSTERRPRGTVTFLLTDVEGSTQLWDAVPEAMRVAIPRHYELLADAIAKHGGFRPVEQGEGDSVVGAFSRASDAVAAALDGQLAFMNEPWPEGARLRVRMAIHTGEAMLREPGYLGETLNRCARIRSTGHGGQVLLSSTTAGLVADRLPAGATLVDLGHQRLKDLGRPERVWQMRHPDLEASFPSLRSMDQYRHNLPVQLTPLVGRVREIQELGDLLTNERLVTLTGAGGVGKTRLAVAASAEALDAHPGGVWWVELGPVNVADGVGHAVLAAIGARDVPEAAIVDSIAAALGDEPSLLVLDNCEHLADACADLVAQLLAAAAATSVLATSREPLAVPGEITWRVPSLDVPESAEGLDLLQMPQYDGIVLFVERARRARPSFALTAENSTTVARICQRLDGIPLAIELAAARCRQVSVERIATELDDRFRLLTGGARTVLARQQTLAASVDWSHDRLDPAERLVFRRLGVFSGAFPLEAAETVVAELGDLELAEVFDVVARLVDKSLVVADERVDGSIAYRQLETLRVYALDRARSADELKALRDAHATWWASWLGPRGDLPTDEVVAEMERFHADIKACLEWSVQDPALGLRVLRLVARAWHASGRCREAMTAVDELLTDRNAEEFGAEWLEAALRSLFLSIDARGDEGSVPLQERVAAAAERLGDPYFVARLEPEDASDDAHPLAVELARERGDEFVELFETAFVASALSDQAPAEAAPWLEVVRTRGTAHHVRTLREAALVAVTEEAASSGDLRAAIELGHELLSADYSSFWMDGVRILAFAGLLARDRASLEAALAAAERGVRSAPGGRLIADEARHRLELLDGVESGLPAGLVTRIPYKRVTARTLWLWGREALDAGEPRTVELARIHARDRAHVRAVLAAVEAMATDREELWHDAMALALEQGLRLVAVDALEGLAVAASRTDSFQESLRLLGAARRLREETRYVWRFEREQQAVDAAERAASQALGPAAAAALDEGIALDWREAAAYARRARGERKRPTHGWASLTPTEEQVVALVAEGLTNPEIAERLLMGRATVKTHLEHVFTKLDVRSRTELAAQASRRVAPSA